MNIETRLKKVSILYPIGAICSEDGNAICQISHYPLDSAIGFPNTNTFLLDSICMIALPIF